MIHSMMMSPSQTKMMLNSFACSHRIFDLCLPRISSHNDQNNNNTHILRLLILFTCYYPPMNPIALRSLTRLAGQNATHLCQTRQALKLFSSQAPKAAAGHSKKAEESFSWLAAATALGLGALGLSPLVSQCHCIHCPEPDDDEPEDNTAKPQEIQKEAEDRRLLGASPTKKTPDNLLPPYVPRHFKDDLDNALDHKASIGESARFGKFTHKKDFTRLSIQCAVECI